MLNHRLKCHGEVVNCALEIESRGFPAKLEVLIKMFSWLSTSLTKVIKFVAESNVAFVILIGINFLSENTSRRDQQKADSQLSRKVSIYWIIKWCGIEHSTPWRLAEYFNCSLNIIQNNTWKLISRCSPPKAVCTVELIDSKESMFRLWFSQSFHPFQPNARAHSTSEATFPINDCHFPF